MKVYQVIERTAGRYDHDEPLGVYATYEAAKAYVDAQRPRFSVERTDYPAKTVTAEEAMRMSQWTTTAVGVVLDYTWADEAKNLSHPAYSKWTVCLDGYYLKEFSSLWDDATDESVQAWVDGGGCFEVVEHDVL